MNTLNLPDHTDILLLLKVLKGTGTEAELQEVKAWLAESIDNKRFYDELSDIWNATAGKEEVLFNAVEGLKKVRERLGQDRNRIVPEESRKVFQSRSLTLFLKVAAVFVLAYGLGLFTYSGFFTGKSGDNSITEIKAPIGSKTQVTLPDGTKVWLNSGSTLRYDAAFNQKQREVSLEGEAFFDVTKKKGRLFLVKTKEVTIRVLGTAFNVKAYPNEGAVATTLVRGSLIVEQNSKGREISQTILKPNQRATFVKDEKNLYLSESEEKYVDQEITTNKVKIEDLKGRALLSKEVDPDEFTAWKDGRLVFKNETFASLSVKLERWYGVKINITDEEIKKYHFNGTIVNETINDVLEIIGFTLPIRYSVQHNVITIHKATMKKF